MTKTRAFLKWAGGKYSLLPVLAEYLPSKTRLIEPFVGSGVVFLNTSYSKYLLADCNADLINLYKVIQTQKTAFIDACQKYFSTHFNNEMTFYELRKQFNESQDINLRSQLFLYLNRHCYNGLCRYNNGGEFNVPFGTYKKPFFPLERMKTFIQKAKKATFVQQDFLTTFEQAKKGDVIYCDPPYLPLSNTAYFSNYAKNGFSIDQHQALAKVAAKTAKKGIPVIISNHDTTVAREMYQQANELVSFPVKRTISSNSNNRVPVQELLAVYD